MTGLGLFNGAKSAGNLRVARFEEKSVRVVSGENCPPYAMRGRWTKNMIMPGYSLRAIDGLISLLGSCH